MRRLHGTVTAVLLLVAAVGPPAAADQPAAWAYRPPVDAPLVDRFRPGAGPYSAGNRGVDYATVAGEPVVSAAPGTVTFAGRVGRDLHVVVLHDDGLRTSYSFLAGVSVRRGHRVGVADVVGTAGAVLHWGARAGSAYLDPLLLLGGPPEVHLVPDAPPAAGSEAGERSSLLRYLGAAARAPGRAAVWGVRWARDGAAAAGRAGRAAFAQTASLLDAALRRAELLGFPNALRTTTTAFRQAFRRCTRPEVEVPRFRSRRLLVQVGGLGSSSGSGAVLDLDEEALGYAPGDVVQFSYRGGRADVNAYTAADTVQDIRESGTHLRVLLRDLRRRHPGVPIDVVAHSQGGLVARQALRGNPDGIERLVTLATPHQGTNLATLWGYLRNVPGRGVVSGAVDGLAGWSAEGTSIGQMSETSAFVDDLARSGIPPGLRFTSIAAAEDVVVPGVRCQVDGATNVLVSAPAVSSHDHLPGSAAGGREVALALNDMAPGCTSLDEALRNAVVAEAVNVVEHRLSLPAVPAAAVRPD